MDIFGGLLEDSVQYLKLQIRDLLANNFSKSRILEMERPERVFNLIMCEESRTPGSFHDL